MTQLSLISEYRHTGKGVVRDRRFTLIELLVVVGVIGILAGFLMPALTRSKARAVETKMMNSILQIHYANIQYQTASDEKFLMNSLSGETVGVDWEPLRDHGFTDELTEDPFRLRTLAEDDDLSSMSLPTLEFNDFHPGGSGLLYFNFHMASPTSTVITRQLIDNQFGYAIPEDTQYMIFGVGINGVYDGRLKPRNDFIYIARESNANIERWPGGQ